MSMILTGRNGNEFELGFVGDSLSDPQDGFGDANIVTINFRVASQSAAWEEDAPALNLYEFSNLAEWLAAIGRVDSASAAPSDIELLQPELRFSVTDQSDDEVTIRVAFQLADRPEEFNVDSPTEDADFLDIHLSREKVLQASEALGRMLKQVNAANLKDDLSGDAQYGPAGATGYGPERGRSRRQAAAGDELRRG